ncbi:ATP-binding protein [Streptomyces sp. DT2A-34]|uniref:ATP-binding protein n=1 Tax=Streptomyces sp. DT2A-34 TaxID=3051182 RepID=UPI00265C2775|nr:ATP-binding protein [Streptomyces sp. DT2A-34]MDO0914308.1 ATP-binding protein [Streptomyces sp. DT2A-34]
MNGEDTRVRLLPWTGAHGQPCLLLTDGDGTASRIADRIEAVQLGLADRLLGRTRDVLSAREPKAGEFGRLAGQLADALTDVLLIARSRGARLGPVRAEPRAFPDGPPAVLPPAGPIHDVLAHSSAEPHGFGSLTFPGRDLASARSARRYVRDTVRSWGLASSAADDLETIVGELVANALEHSDSRTITVTCALTAGRVTVTVTDEGAINTPAACAPTRPPGPDQEHGRGLLITEALSARWGSRRTGNGLTVWAELDAEPREPAQR